MEDLVTYEIAKKLKEKGFDEGCEFTFYNNYRVRDEIYEKHPGLSDDGYEDLRKKYGGSYKDEEVYGYYIEPLKLYSRNSTIGINPITKQKVPTSELCSCPNIYQVMKWLRHNEIFIDVQFNRFYKRFKVYVYGISENSYDMHENHFFNTYEDAAVAGIEYAIDNLI